MPEPSNQQGRLPICTRCRFYFVTYEPGRPHGCKAFRFKSRRSPAIDVFENSGVICQMFQETGRKDD